LGFQQEYLTLPLGKQQVKKSEEYSVAWNADVISYKLGPY